LQALLAEPLLQEFPHAPSPFFRKLVACTGTDYCNLALIETKRRANELSKALEQRLGTRRDALSIHWSGCPAGCGNHQAADIGLRGVRANIGGKVIDAVSIYVGGSTRPNATVGEQILEAVPCDEALPDLIGTIIEHFDLFKQVQRDPAAGDRILMVPAGATESLLTEERDLSAWPTRTFTHSASHAEAKSQSAASHIRITEKVCSVEELSRRRFLRVSVLGKQLAIFADGDRIFATDLDCPHAGAPLDRGTIENGRLVCPLHAYCFDLLNGTCDADPRLVLTTYRVFAEGGAVFVDLGQCGSVRANPHADDAVQSLTS